MRRRSIIGLLAAAVLLSHPDGYRAQEEPQAVPFIEREEVRLVTLDLVASEKTRGGWTLMRDLRRGQLRVQVGSRVMEIDVFENRCAPEVIPPPVSRGAPGSVPVAGNTAAVERDAATPAAPPERYVLYFDMEHLHLLSRDAAFDAAVNWAKAAATSHEAMIITAGHGLRIVRPMLPAAEHLLDDIEAARGDFRHSELWGEYEWQRVKEIKGENIRSLREALIAQYTAIDYSKTKRSLKNLKEVMAVFDTIEGTKNLLVFADTIRLKPGGQYPMRTTEPPVIYQHLDQLAEAANERNVRIYPVKAGIEEKADDAFTFLATETGGQYIEGTNRIDVVFDRVEEDSACFYRAGFRFQPRYDGRTSSIVVNIVGRDGEFRLRHRRTLKDPTREEIDTDIVRAVLMVPSSANDFPISVSARELYRHGHGSRVRARIEVALAELLPLPAPGGPPGTRQVRVQVGGLVVPQRLPDDAGTEPSGRGVWRDVASERDSLDFGRQSVLTLPSSTPGHGGQDRIVQIEEFDAPPGRYRAVVVIQDQLARTVAARVIDFEVAGVPPRLGPIGLAGRDSRAVIIGDRPAGDDAGKASKWNGEELIAVPSILPPGAVIIDDARTDAGNEVHLYYSVCADELQGRKKRLSADPPFEGWRLDRILTCGSGDGPVRLPPRPLPALQNAGRCVPLVESIAPENLPVGRCRFAVRLELPGGEIQESDLEFRVVPRTAKAGTTLGALTPRHDSFTCRG